MKKKPPPSSRFLRSAYLAAAGASILTKELGGYAKGQVLKKVDAIKEQTRIEQIKVLTEALSRLKGSAMKFGQLLSFEAQEYLPPEAVEILAKLQKNAEPVDNELLFEVIRKDLGEARFQALSLQEKPLATASVGQVYRGRVVPVQGAEPDSATSNATEVAVKVQFPNVRGSISSDLAMIRKVAPLALSLFGKHMDINDLLAEVEVVLLLETDYLQEMSSLEKYRKIFADDGRFRVPRPLKEYSSSNVLTMTFEEGIHLRDWIASAPSVPEREQIGRALLDLYLKEFFENGLVQTDPNLANFLVQGPNHCLVLLDCGAVLQYPLDFIVMYKELIRVVRERSEDDIIRFCIDKNLLDPKEEKGVQRKFVDMVRISVLPFDPALQPFDFSNRDYSGQVRDSLFEFSRAAKYSRPPKEFVFLHRKLGGLFHILKMLELRIDLTPYWHRAVESIQSV